MSYVRVVPRDLFNEANLLKCLGRLYIVTEQFTSVTISEPEPGEPFQIEQSDDDGSLQCLNVQLVINGQAYTLTRPLNSRAAWPLRITHIDAKELAEYIDVFTEDGNLAPEVLSLVDGTAGTRTGT